MKNTETGEFELVLGNRQLLSGFFIVVLLFGVAFAMGYIVGRSSTPSSRTQADASSNSVAKDARPQPATAAVAAPAPPASDQPAAPQPENHGPEPQAAEAPAQPTTQPAREAPPASAPEVTPAAATVEAPPGSYWQVIATSNRTSAEALQQGLKDKGFPVTLSPGPNNLVRVLVGPYTDTQSMGRAKTKLEDAGFHTVRK